MHKDLFMRRGGEGVALWVKIIAIFGAIALSLSALTIAPTASAVDTGDEMTADEIISMLDESAGDLPGDGNSTPEAGDSNEGSGESTEETGEATENSEGATGNPGEGTDALPNSPPEGEESQTFGPLLFAAEDVNPAIVVEITNLVKEGSTTEDPITVSDRVAVSGTWDASAANPQPGDQFTIGFPPELAIPANQTFELTGPHGSWGDCIVEADNTITCTLSGLVAHYPDEVHGTWDLEATATTFYSEETINFNLNGVITPVDLPGEGGIDDGFEPGEASKKGELRPDKQSVAWTIEIPGTLLADESNTGLFTLQDELSANMKLCVESPVEVALQSKDRTGSYSEVTDGGVTITDNGVNGDVRDLSLEINNNGNFKATETYKFTYVTCTTSGEVEIDGQYDNTFWIGEKGYGDGVGQDWREPTEPTKNGRLLEADRFGQLQWDIIVPGTFLQDATTESIKIQETLGGPQQVCADGLKLQVWEQDFLPGLGESANNWKPTTMEATTDAVAGTNTFEITATREGGFEADKNYIIRYITCSTLDEIPDGEDSFTNAAVVNGTEINKTVTGKDFNSGKKGHINYEVTEVAGEQMPAGTTIDWEIEVSGHELEGVTEPLTLTDTFSETLAVCEVDGVTDIKQLLNLSVTAVDYVTGDRANDTVDLTEATTVNFDEATRELTFTLPKPEGHYSRDWVYHIDYTLCTASGGVDSRPTTYGNSVEGLGKTLTDSTTMNWSASGTGQGVARGSFELSKTQAWDSADIDPSLVFNVKVEEFAPDNPIENNAPNETYTREVSVNGSVSGIYARGEGWKIRLSEVDYPDAPGLSFAPGKFIDENDPNVEVAEDGSWAIVTITPRTNVAVTLENKASDGEVVVTKRVVGDAVDNLTGEERFEVTARFDYDANGTFDDSDTFILRTDGQKILKDLPIGTVVTFEETQPGNTDGITWGTPVFDPAVLIVSADPAASAVTLTNTANPTYGDFTVSKKIEALDGVGDSPHLPESFDVIATWTQNNEEKSHTLSVPVNGTVSFAESYKAVDPSNEGKLPAGTVVTLAEVLPDNGNGLAWTAATFVPGNEIRIGLDTVSVKLKNHVGKNDGTLQILKGISGEAADELAGVYEFTVTAEWKEPGSTATNWVSKELDLKNDGVAVPLGVDLPVGTEVRFTEIDLPDLDGIEWGTPQWATHSPEGDWLSVDDNGVATGIVSDDPSEGRIIKLTNTANWKLGELQIDKKIVEDGEVVEVEGSSLDDSAEFTVRITGIDPPLADDVNFPKVGQDIQLNKANNWSWSSGKVLPKGTEVTFTEVDPAAGPGYDWAKPLYVLGTDGEDGLIYGATVEITGEDKTDTVEIHNRLIPTTEVVIDKSVTGPKGNEVENDSSSTFQVTAEWTDADEQDRQCIINVKPNGTAVPTTSCDATVIDGKIYFPKNSEITFTETGATTDVSNVKWGEVIWSIIGGDADINENGEKSATVTITGDEGVTLGLENKTSSNGLIIIPIPIPIPEWPGFPGSSTPPGPGEPGTPTEPGQPTEPGTPTEPGKPTEPTKPSHPGKPGHPVSPEKQAEHAQAVKGKGGGLAVTGANVAWLAGGALALILAGAWLTLRRRNKES